MYTSVARADGPSVTMSSNDFPSKPWFVGIYVKFQWWKSFKNQYLPTDGIQILAIKFHEILLIKIFPTTPKAHFNSS